MIAFFLLFIANSFVEIGTTIGKDQTQKRQHSIYTMGFLNLLWSTVFFLFFAFFVRQGFFFSLASLPTFIPRVILEIVQAHFTVLAIKHASRSTFSFIRVLTIPLLLIVDLILGYRLNPHQILGIVIIAVALILLLVRRSLKTKGIFFVLFTAVNAVITLSLYKYDITHFNSVEAEQSLALSVVTAYFMIMALLVAKENPLRFLAKPIFLTQSLLNGAGDVIISFSYLFAPASVITTIKRSISVLFSVMSGHFYFGEKYLMLKILAFILVAGGLLLLVF